MNISKIANDLKNQKSFPPVDSWNPKLCEGQEFYINREGEWFYNDSPIKNKKLVNLFSTVLRKDVDEYYLITPYEKVLVKVELAPYKIVDFDLCDNNVKLITNLNYEFFLDKNNSTRLIRYDKTMIPLVIVRKNLEGFFNRNTYYKMIDIALENNYIDNDSLYIPSNDHNHVIGKIA